MVKVLLERLLELEDQPDPRFAFLGTVNWMRALAILVDADSFKNAGLAAGYESVQRRSPNEAADTVALDNLLMAHHNHVSLKQMVKHVSNPYDIVRSAVVAWYYSVYFSSGAMVAASSGASTETHAASIKRWHAEILTKELAIAPFDFHLDSLTGSETDERMKHYKSLSRHKLVDSPNNSTDAVGAVVAYLSGTLSFEQWKAEERARETKEFRALNVNNFRTNAAREIRDRFYANGRVNFLTQAFRYRGKANYRDSIFLTYGDDNCEKVKLLCDDLVVVSRAYQRMAASYVSRRIEKGLWSTFLTDIKNNKRITGKAAYLNV